MKKGNSAPAKDAELWKDALYEEIKNLHGNPLEQFLKERAQSILNEYGVSRRVKMLPIKS